MRGRWILGILTTSLLWAGTGERPYRLVSKSDLPLDTLFARVENTLQDNDFEVLGSYIPAQDSTRRVLVFTAPELLEAVAATKGLRGFASALRLGFIGTAGQTEVSLTNPVYWGNAYFQKQYPEVEHLIIILEKRLSSALDVIPGRSAEAFGSEEGFTAAELRKYHYMFGMEYFQDVVELAEYPDFESGKRIIESKLADDSNLDLVYALAIPGTELKLYGIKLGGETGEAHFLPIIDIGQPRHTAFLPYEILLDGNRAVMLHGRYRIALSFPDLTMITFSKIMSTPGDIESLMRRVTQP